MVGPAKDRMQRRQALGFGCALVLGVLVLMVESTAGMGHAQTAAWLHAALGAHLQGSTIETLNVFLRKCGHMTGFGLFGLTVSGCLRLFTVCRFSGLRLHSLHRFAPLLGVLAASVAGVCDELHQSFLPTRHASAGDVVLDTAGAALLITCSALVRAWPLASPLRYPILLPPVSADLAL